MHYFSVADYARDKFTLNVKSIFNTKNNYIQSITIQKASDRKTIQTLSSRSVFCFERACKKEGATRIIAPSRITIYS